MSYTVDIVQGAVPASDREAWAALEGWREDLYSGKEGNVSPEMRALHDKFVARFPCITVDESGPWSDGPLINDFGRRMVILGIVYSRVHEVLPFVLKTSMDMGFTVFDGQDEFIHRPGVAPNASQPKKVPWWKVWNR